MLSQTFGFLQSLGRAKAFLNLPPALPSSLVGGTIHHAFVTIGFGPAGVTSTSNAVALTFVP